MNVAVNDSLRIAASSDPIRYAVVRDVPEIAVARTCYDHVAGRLGVALFRSLVALDAIRDVRTPASARKVRSGLGDVALGRGAKNVFGDLAIDVDDVASARRQFATACCDWTESRPHLGGALGAALQQRLLREGWLVRASGTRALHITSAGREALRTRFSIDAAQLVSARN